jgi:hypothetical protein
LRNFYFGSAFTPVLREAIAIERAALEVEKALRGQWVKW